MTTRKDLARDALYSAIADILSAYHLPTEDKCEDAAASFIDRPGRYLLDTSLTGQSSPVGE